LTASQTKKQVRITPRARDDLKNIGRYTERKWGKAQRNTYLKRLATRFNWLAENPQLGQHRTDIEDGYYCFPEGQHLVFYLIRRHAIDIIGVPHKEMDIINHFTIG
jgi:Plasmid stabilization system protein